MRIRVFVRSVRFFVEIVRICLSFGLYSDSIWQKLLYRLWFEGRLLGLSVCIFFLLNLMNFFLFGFELILNFGGLVLNF